MSQVTPLERPYLKEREKTTLAQADTRDTDKVGGGQPHNSNFESLCLIWTRPDHSNLEASWQSRRL